MTRLFVQFCYGQAENINNTIFHFYERTANFFKLYLSAYVVPKTSLLRRRWE